MAGAIDESLRKVHASLNVSNLSRSIEFYRALLGAEPAKVRPDYAKFDLADPPLVLSLIPGVPAAGGVLNHAGLRVRNAEELVEIQRRLEAAGLHTEREEGVECCYARQTKFWITDPDGALWEIYVFHDDIDDRGDASQRVAQPLIVQAPSARPVAWEHRLRDPLPERVPYEDNTLHEIRLDGSINTVQEAPNRSTLFAECLRVLRPGGQIFVHGLAGDRETRPNPALPGPAAAVQHVPSTSQVVDELHRSGFVEILIEKLSETAYFVVDGVPMRELRVVARKPGYRPKISEHGAVYLGPMAELIDDLGNRFRRGEVTPLNVHDWQMLSKSPMCESFLLMKPDGPKGTAVRDPILELQTATKS